MFNASTSTGIHKILVRPRCTHETMTIRTMQRAAAGWTQAQICLWEQLELPISLTNGKGTTYTILVETAEDHLLNRGSAGGERSHTKHPQGVPHKIHLSPDRSCSRKLIYFCSVWVQVYLVASLSPPTSDTPLPLKYIGKYKAMYEENNRIYPPPCLWHRVRAHRVPSRNVRGSKNGPGG